MTVKCILQEDPKEGIKMIILSLNVKGVGGSHKKVNLEEIMFNF